MSVHMYKPIGIQSVVAIKPDKVLMALVLHVFNLNTEAVDDRPTMIDIEIDVTAAERLIEGLKGALTTLRSCG